MIRTYQQKWARTLLFPFQKVRAGKQYVFILGCYNSGTTLLNHILGAHSEISSLPTEGVVLTSGLTRPEDFDWPRMWHMCEDKIRFTEDTAGPDPDRVKRDWSFWFDKDKKIYLEKSIANSAKIRWLESNFDNPYFLWIIRNGYCVAEGIRRRSRDIDANNFSYAGPGYPIDMCARQWVINNAVIAADAAHVRNFFKLSYEDLTEDTTGTIRKILDWLPVETGHLETDEIGAFQFHRVTRPIENMNSESLDRLSENDIHKINSVAREYLERWDYTVLGE